jgi:formylglycine-generating enzyme required for sulfatase activity
VYYIDSSYTTPLRVSTTSNTITYTTAGTQDDPYIKASSTYNTDMANCTAKGFRLPASSEYEYAARYRGSDPANTVPGHANPYYTKGNSASGATADYTNATATSLVAVYGVSTTAVVKSKRANALGIYDMSGNVYEWCFDWYGSFYRVLRGCSFSYDISGTPVGGVFVASPYTASGSGRFSSFRFSRTK